MLNILNILTQYFSIFLVIRAHPHSQYLMTISSSHQLLLYTSPCCVELMGSGASFAIRYVNVPANLERSHALRSARSVTPDRLRRVRRVRHRRTVPEGQQWYLCETCPLAYLSREPIVAACPRCGMMWFSSTPEGRASAAELEGLFSDLMSSDWMAERLELQRDN